MKVKILNKVIKLLEESAKGGNVFAMFNLGIAHFYGYTGQPNIKLAIEWFEYSNLPEGFIISSRYYDSIDDEERAKFFKEKAENLGYGQKWRNFARQKSGLGGASGVDINLPWPQTPNGIKPFKF